MGEAGDLSGLQFLGEVDPILLRKFAQANKFVWSQPDLSLTAARTFGELLLNEVAIRRGARRGRYERQMDFINRLLDENLLPQSQANVFHYVRKAGNTATHEGGLETPQDAQKAASAIRRLAIWFRDEVLETAQAAVANEAPPVDHSTSADFLGRPSRMQNEQITTLPAYEFKTYTSPLPDFPGPVPHRPSYVGAVVAFSILILLSFATWQLLGGSPSGTSEPDPNSAGSNMPDASVASAPDNSNADTATNIQAFSSPQTFVVTPLEGSEEVSERGGPGTDYPNVAALSRGTQILGAGRVIDAAGQSWIVLSDGSGYVNESLLSTAMEGEADVGNGSPLPDTPPQHAPDTRQPPVTAGIIVGSVSRYDDTWNCLILRLSPGQVSVGDTVIVALPNPVRARVERVNGTDACAEPFTTPPDDVAGKTVMLAIKR